MPRKKKDEVKKDEKQNIAPSLPKTRAAVCALCPETGAKLFELLDGLEATVSQGTQGAAARAGETLGQSLNVLLDEIAGKRPVEVRDVGLAAALEFFPLKWHAPAHVVAASILAMTAPLAWSQPYWTERPPNTTDRTREALRACYPNTDAMFARVADIEHPQTAPRELTGDLRFAMVVEDIKAAVATVRGMPTPVVATIGTAAVEDLSGCTPNTASHVLTSALVGVAVQRLTDLTPPMTPPPSDDGPIPHDDWCRRLPPLK